MHSSIKGSISFIILVLLSTTFASANYISGKITVSESGLATFDVQTDSPINAEGLSFSNNNLLGTTNLLTKKEGDIWTFELNGENYTNILLDIQLPKNLETITKISGNTKAIDINNKIVSIIDSGKLYFSASYKLQQTADYSWIVWIILMIIIAVAIIIFFQRKKKKDRLKTIMPLINESEQKIIDALMKKSFRQKQLRESLNIPKASFTRYILNLEKKKLLRREGDGKNKIIHLK